MINKLINSLRTQIKVRLCVGICADITSKMPEILSIHDLSKYIEHFTGSIVAGLWTEWESDENLTLSFDNLIRQRESFLRHGNDTPDSVTEN